MLIMCRFLLGGCCIFSPPPFGWLLYHFSPTSFLLFSPSHFVSMAAV
ncbi:hypothetical protein GLYMA_08G329350v4 [Glycine max]|nr:hypothetical protein GLYMA_08G329350v4 [Glycine max]KAH1054272.1 hypothetical protein GYH30_023172 [Glycine max]